MARLEDLTRGAAVKGILPDSLVTVVDVKWYGSAVVELTDKDVSGRSGNELLYRDREPTRGANDITSGSVLVSNSGSIFCHWLWLKGCPP